MRVKIFQIFILAFVLLPFAGCRSTNSANTANIEQREVADDLGRKVKVPIKIERVVSLAPNITENVFAVGAGEKLVGVTSFCNFPEEAKKLPKVGDTMTPNLETVVALKPQLVLVSTDSQLEAFFGQMERQSIPVFVTDAKNFEDVLRNIKQIGDLLGVSANAERLTQDLQNRAATIESKIKNEKPVRVFVQISREPLYTIGKTSFVTDLVRRAGGESVTANVETAYPKINRETALAAEPEAILLSFDESMGTGNSEPDEAFKNSPAVKNYRVYKINGDLMTRPSARIVDLIEQIARVLHPSAF